MDQSAARIYFCPMHSDVRQPGAGKCPKCGMDLLPEGTRFAMLRHMSRSPMMIVVAAVVAIAIVYALFK